MRKRLWLLIGASSVIALVDAACGGGTGATATTKPAATAPTTATVQSTVTPRPTVTPQPTPTPPPAPAGSQPKYGGILQARDFRDSPNLDTWDVQGGFALAPQNLMSNLIHLGVDNPSQLVPDVAERWEQTSGGQSIKFSIRKGVKWHDGKQLNAEDIRWNLERGMRAEGTTTNNKLIMDNVASVAAPDDTNVVVNLKRVSASFLPNIGKPFVLLYPPHGPVPNSQQFKVGAIGTGPFKLKSYASTVKMELVRNGEYYKTDEAGRSLPYLNGITIFFIPDPAQGLAAFRTKQIDCGCLFDQDYMATNKDVLEREIAGVKLTVRNTAIHAIFFDQKEPWTNPLVRKAVLAGLDRVKVKDSFYQGRAFYPPTILRSPDLAGKWGLPTAEMLQTPGFRVKDGKKDPADLQLAAQLFQQAGVAPKNITVTVRASSFFPSEGEIVASTLTDIGLKVNLVVPPAGPQERQALVQRQFDIAFMTGGQVFDDPSDVIPGYILSDGLNNFGKWSRPEIDALYQRMEAELDSDKRMQLAYELQRKVLDEAVFSPLVYLPVVLGTREYVFGYKVGAFTTTAHLRLERVWIDESLR